MASEKLPITSLPVWATFNNVRLSNVKIESIDGKGQGLIAETELSALDGSEPPVLLRVPHEVTLCEDVISGYAKADKRFYELLEVLGPQVTF